MMRGREMLYFLLDEIEDARQITPLGHPLILDPANKLNNRLSPVDLRQLLTKLERDEQVIKVIYTLEDSANAILDYYGKYEDLTSHCYRIQLLPTFLKYYQKIQQEKAYQEFTGKKPEFIQSKKEEEEVVKQDDIVYEVKFLETREILINNFLISKPDFNRENEIVFSYAYSHPYERISKLAIEKENKTRLLKSLPKIVENLGFTGDRKIFFDVSSEGIFFRNPITKKQLDELKIEYLKLK